MRAHDFTLRQLQYAVAVADTGGVRRAAEVCHVSQPSLSAQLAQLEAALGVRLFERGRHGAVPTAHGERMIARARRILVEADDLLRSAGELGGDPFAGRLRLGAIPTLAPYVLPELTAATRRAHPRIRLEWQEAKTESLVHEVARGSLDAALVALESQLGELDHVPIASDPFLLATAPGHPLAKLDAVRPEDLDGVPVLLLDEGHCLRDQVWDLCRRVRRPREADFRATSLATLAQVAASSGDAVTVLPELAVPFENRGRLLEVRPFRPSPGPARTVVMAFRRRAPAAAALRELAETLQGAWPASSLSAGTSC